MMSDFLKPDRNSELYAPLIWPTETNHKGLPKTYSQVCGIDTGRDELLMYDDMLKSEGIKTRLDLYPGLATLFLAFVQATTAVGAVGNRYFRRFCMAFGDSIRFEDHHRCATSPTFSTASSLDYVRYHKKIVLCHPCQQKCFSLSRIIPVFNLQRSHTPKVSH